MLNRAEPRSCREALVLVTGLRIDSLIGLVRAGSGPSELRLSEQVTERLHFQCEDNGGWTAGDRMITGAA
jgi:hypothetical protein